jgi:hypothetical protein
MMQDQWIGRIEIALGAAIEMTGRVLRSSDLKEQGVHKRIIGSARLRYGRSIAAVVGRSR